MKRKCKYNKTTEEFILRIISEVKGSIDFEDLLVLYDLKSSSRGYSKVYKILRAGRDLGYFDIEIADDGKIRARYTEKAQEYRMKVEREKDDRVQREMLRKAREEYKSSALETQEKKKVVDNYGEVIPIPFSPFHYKEFRREMIWKFNIRDVNDEEIRSKRHMFLGAKSKKDFARKLRWWCMLEGEREARRKDAAEKVEFYRARRPMPEMMKNRHLREYLQLAVNRMLPYYAEEIQQVI